MRVLSRNRHHEKLVQDDVLAVPGQPSWSDVDADVDLPQFLAGVNVLDPHRRVCGMASDQAVPAVRSQVDPVAPTALRLGRTWLTGFQVPGTDRRMAARDGWVVASRNRPLAVGRESHASDPPGKARQRA